MWIRGLPVCAKALKERNLLKDTVTCLWYIKSYAVCLSEQLSHNHKGNSSEVYFFANLHLVFLLLFCILCFESTFPCQQQSRAQEVRNLPPTIARTPHLLPTCLLMLGWPYPPAGRGELPLRAHPSPAWKGSEETSIPCVTPQHLEINCASSEGKNYRYLLSIHTHPIAMNACSCTFLSLVSMSTTGLMQTLQLATTAKPQQLLWAQLPDHDGASYSWATVPAFDWKEQ